ncbi:MAG: metalloregulator ArsR/SmtB family transcription factor [Lachnospiraceae bacterium]|nr:metalloregulator ArsR/SmtB family transcription factor [Lachnospiraceae bacterium]
MSDHKKMAAMFKAFADENRIQILELLRDGERCACMLLEEMKITQPTLSHHMKILCDAGVVVGRKEGKWMHYSISEDGIRDVRNYLDELMANTKGEDDSPESCS